MARAIARSVADVIEQLELDGDVVVSADRLAEILRILGRDRKDARQVAYELQRAGWLGTLRTRNVWEFLPGARAGAFSSGDRFLEFRAQRAVDPSWGGVLAMESAASVLGLAQRLPEREVVALPKPEALPKAMLGAWRSVGIQLPDVGITEAGQLPTWNLEGLLAGIAIRPTSYRDTPGLAQWLPEVGTQVDSGRLIRLLEAATPMSRQRAAYLLGVAGNVEARERLADRYPPAGVAWFGPRSADGAFDKKTQVNDTLLHPYLTVGGAA